MLAEELHRLSDLQLHQLDPPAATAVPLLENYLLSQQHYQLLEDGYLVIKRKLLPGVHAYRTISVFDKDVEEFISSYRQQAAQDGKGLKEELLHEFELRLQWDRVKLETKLSRPVGLPSASMLSQGIANLRGTQRN